MWGWLLVLLIPGTTDIYVARVENERLCMEIGIEIEEQLREQLKVYIPKGSTFECVKTV